MRPTAFGIVLSPSDLGRFLSCKHLTALDLAVAKKLRPKPPVYPDPVLEVLKQRGFDHEKSFVDKQEQQGLRVVDLRDGTDRIAETIAAMKAGADLIVQGMLQLDCWEGYPDVLRKIEAHSTLGAWSYEVIDTKLARDTKGTTILQLSLYSEMVAAIQGISPECFFVVTPEREEEYRVSEYAAYYRLVKQHLLETMIEDPIALAADSYPEPVPYCEMCRWEQECTKKRRADDHLSLVAGISRLQRREFEIHSVETLAKVAVVTLPLIPAPARGSKEGYARVRDQARVQLEGREKQCPIHEMLPIREGEGLTRLPKPSRGDIFLDLEGDPFVDEGGREYLFGLITHGADGEPEYRAFWAMTPAEERVAFESVIDFMTAALESDPDMHIYHYAGYEPGAMKRLMGRYATREAEVDRLLRGDRFVDLLTVVKQSLRASVESYSIKKLEEFYGFKREMDLRMAGDRRAVIERCLELDARSKITAEDRDIVAAYNRDDCVSTLRLQEWLEKLRAELISAGTGVPRPKPPKDEEASDKVKDRDVRIQALVARLTAGVPDDRAKRSPEQHARWIMAHMLDFHRREDKVTWWEYFDLRDKDEDEWLEADKVICGLEFVERVAKARTRVTDRYRFPPQSCRVRVDEELRDGDGKFGKVVAIDRGAGVIDILKAGSRTDEHPTRLFAFGFVPSAPLPDALERIGNSIANGGIESPTEYRAACSLLLREKPRLNAFPFERAAGESTLNFAVRAGLHLDGTVLPIQGPPGSGKTYTGAHMICAMVRAGLRVGITANSHAVILNLMGKVLKQAEAEKLEVRCGHKVGRDKQPAGDIVQYSGNDLALDALRARDIHVLGATAWLWASEGARDAVDVLVVDEAGQMKMANVIAASNAANSLVLLGDPQQLDQPQRGSHPDGTEVSALAHVLEDHKVIPEDRGIFLAETYRMAPPICAFCSEVFYENKLTSRPELTVQCLAGAAPFDGAGLWRVNVEHTGNTNESLQEVEVVKRMVERLLAPGTSWTNGKGVTAPITAKDILVVAPYNLQVDALREQLDRFGISAGTVDKFQGQEAAVVIFSMACSSPSDASRGIEFLYDLSRLNVATSRARCATILVASPRLFEPECSSPRQMLLANALCRYVEMSQAVAV
jgi:uncharacterized protein